MWTKEQQDKYNKEYYQKNKEVLKKNASRKLNMLNEFDTIMTEYDNHQNYGKLINDLHSLYLRQLADIDRLHRIAQHIPQEIYVEAQQKANIIIN